MNAIDQVTIPVVGHRLTVTGAVLMAALLSGLSGCGGENKTSPVIKENTAPQVNAGKDISVKPGQLVKLSGRAGDADGLISSYLWQQTSGKSVSMNDDNTDEVTFVAPKTNKRQVLKFTLTVADDKQATAQDELVVTVIPGNRPPELSLGQDLEVDAASTVSLVSQASDPDGRLVSYTWVQTGGEAVVLEGAKTKELRFSAPDAKSPQQLVFKLTVKDNQGASATADIGVIVNPLKVVVKAPEVKAKPQQSPNEKGLAIALERKARDQGWGDSLGKVTMLLRNQHGEESLRKIQMKALEIDGDGDKSLTVFDHPRDIKGTAFLTFSHSNTQDDQWLYLPALKRVKRIASRNKSGPFMGSEFSYEDLSSFEIDKYRYRYIRDDTVNGEACFVIEQIPTDKYTGYTKLLVWVDKAHYREQKIEFYDRKNALLKTLNAQDYEQYHQRYWRPHKLSMVNHQTAKTTELITHNLEFNTGLTESDFNKNSLKRVR